MALLEIKNLSFAYPADEYLSLDNVNLSVNPGEFVTICGSSGSGKSTLLKNINPLIAPCGKRKGKISVDGKNIFDIDKKHQAEMIGFVGQSPDNRIVSDKVWHELSFGLESLGYPQNIMQSRIAETAAFFGLEASFRKNTAELSGGQKQLVLLASVLVTHPDILLLDEPTSMLDPIAASNFISLLKRINLEFGTTIIIAEHNLEELIPISDKLCILSRGSITYYDKPSNICTFLSEPDCDKNLIKYMPTPLQIHYAVLNNMAPPFTVRDGKQWLKNYSENHRLLPIYEASDTMQNNTREYAAVLSDICFRYEKNLPDVINNLSVKIQKGEFLCIMGGNGVGKTTLLSIICGILTPYCGKINVNGKLAFLPQNPQILFAKNTVIEELTTDFNIADGINIDEILKICRLENLKNYHPFDLSGGEQQRLAFAKILLCNPDILLLDEPTKGFDQAFKDDFADILQNLRQKGITVIAVTHDVEFAARHASQCALFFDGRIICKCSPRVFFCSNNFYTTSANRMAKEIIPNAITAEDIIKSCGGNTNHHTDIGNSNSEKRRHIKEADFDNSSKDSKNANKFNLFQAVISVFLVFLTIMCNTLIFGGTAYNLTSIAILSETILTFYLLFRKSDMNAKRIAIIASLCSLAVVSRAAFYMLPQFKPVIAIVIISGIVLGSRDGFIIGAVTMFVSNMLFGQGPWTPWQMAAMGIVGYLSGYAKILSGKRAFLAAYGALVAVCVYGLIMNIANVYIYMQSPNLQVIAASIITGFPFDMIQAAATALFLWFGSSDFIKKLSRLIRKQQNC